MELASRRGGAIRRSILQLIVVIGLAPKSAFPQSADISAEQRVRDLGLQLPRFSAPAAGNNP